MFLIAEMENIDSKSFRNAITTTFEFRSTHPFPEVLPKPPLGWVKPFNKMAEDVDIDLTLDEAFEKLEMFINPILHETGNFKWDPKIWEWVTRREN